MVKSNNQYYNGEDRIEGQKRRVKRKRQRKWRSGVDAGRRSEQVTAWVY
jgi:hypothetical protein